MQTETRICGLNWVSTHRAECTQLRAPFMCGSPRQPVEPILKRLVSRGARSERLGAHLTPRVELYVPGLGALLRPRAFWQQGSEDGVASPPLARPHCQTPSRFAAAYAAPGEPLRPARRLCDCVAACRASPRLAQATAEPAFRQRDRVGSLTASTRSAERLGRSYAPTYPQFSAGAASPELENTSKYALPYCTHRLVR